MEIAWTSLWSLCSPCLPCTRVNPMHSYEDCTLKFIIHFTLPICFVFKVMSLWACCVKAREKTENCCHPEFFIWACNKIQKKKMWIFRLSRWILRVAELKQKIYKWRWWWWWYKATCQNEACIKLHMTLWPKMNETGPPLKSHTHLMHYACCCVLATKNCNCYKTLWKRDII